MNHTVFSHALIVASVLFAIAIPVVRAGGSLEDEMKILKKVTRELGKFDNNWDNALALAKQAGEAAAKSRELVPEKIADITDEAAKKAALEDYKNQMDELVKAFATVEQACKAKDEAKFKSAVEALAPIKKKGHDTFTEEKK